MDNFNFYIFLKSVVNSDSREHREMEKFEPTLKKNAARKIMLDEKGLQLQKKYFNSYFE